MKQLLFLFCAAAASLLGSASAHAREVTSFCNGWEFKKGPIAAEPVKAVAAWNGKWEAVEIPHTWNATDMQTKYNDFYARSEEHTSELQSQR